MHNTRLTALFISVLFSLTAWPAFAEALADTTTPDEEQPVHISADSLDIQDQTGLSVYTGRVEVIQGSLTLNGDRITIQHPERSVQSIKVTGQQARFKRFDAVEQTWVKGRADFIHYQADERTLLLIGSAKVEQPGKHLITGPKLFYDMQNKTLKAQSTPKQKQRISVTLMPEPATKDKNKP